MEFIYQMSLKKLFQPDYLFQTTPPPDSLYKYLAIIFVLFVVAAIVFWRLEKKQKEIYKKYYHKLTNVFLATGITGLILIFFRFEEIPYISSRIMLIALILAFLIWLGFIGWYRWIILPKEIAKIKEEENFYKYLPQSAKRKI